MEKLKTFKTKSLKSKKKKEEEKNLLCNFKFSTII